MQRWAVNLPDMNRLASDLEGKHTVLSSARATVGSIRQNPAVSGESRRAVTSVLDQIMASMEQEERSIKNFGTSLYRVAASYQNCEQRVLEHATGAVLSGGGSGRSFADSDENTSENPISWKWKDTWKMISQAGIAGAGIGGIGNLITGEGNLKTVLDSGKFLTKAVGGVCTVLAKGGSRATWGSYLFGMNDALAGINTSSPGKAFVSSMNKQFGSDLNMADAKGWNKGKVGAKWAGHALTAITNGVENYGEFQSGEIGAGRAVAETVLETGTDIAIGAAATAAATAVATAGAAVFGATAAPALVVGAAAVGITWAVNGVCKWATGGKDVGEVVADAVCDVGEKAVSVAKDIGKAAGNAVKSLKKAAAKWSRMFSFG